MADRNNILQPATTTISETEMIEYVANHLTDEQRNAIEQEMMADEFTKDAIEGLETLPEKQNIKQNIEALNLHIQKISTQKKHSRKKIILNNEIVTISIIIMLAICIIGYYILHLKGFK